MYLIFFLILPCKYARLLKRLGRVHQVLAITHNPVIAAAADKHFVVSRITRSDPESESESDEGCKDKGNETETETETSVKKSVSRSKLKPVKDSKGNSWVGCSSTISMINRLQISIRISLVAKLPLF